MIHLCQDTLSEVSSNRHGQRKKVAWFSEYGLMAFCKGCKSETLIPWTDIDLCRVTLREKATQAGCGSLPFEASAAAYCKHPGHDEKRLAVFVEAGQLLH